MPGCERHSVLLAGRKLTFWQRVGGAISALLVLVFTGKRSA